MLKSIFILVGLVLSAADARAASLTAAQFCKLDIEETAKKILRETLPELPKKYQMFEVERGYLITRSASAGSFVLNTAVVRLSCDPLVHANLFTLKPYAPLLDSVAIAKACEYDPGECPTERENFCVAREVVKQARQKVCSP